MGVVNVLGLVVGDADDVDELVVREEVLVMVVNVLDMAAGVEFEGVKDWVEAEDVVIVVDVPEDKVEAVEAVVDADVED